MRTRIYSLQTDKSGKPLLCFTLGLKIAFEDSETIRVELSPDEIVTFKKSDWVNKNRVWDNGKVFFILASKWLSQDYAFDLLMKYALTKIDSRIEHLKALKQNYQKQLNRAA